METDVQNDDLDVSLKQDAALENGKYTIFVEIISWVYIGNTLSKSLYGKFIVQV